MAIINVCLSYKNEHMNDDQNIQHYRKFRKGSNILPGLFILAIGGLLLMRQMGFFFPYWFFTWPMLLIAIGVFVGLRHGFRGGGWVILILIGGIFLIDNFNPAFNLRQYMWPIILIAIGLVILFRPKRYGRWKDGRYRARFHRWQERYGVPAADEPQYSKEDYLDITSVFGGVKKIVVSKNFKGGDITNFMGGTEVNLTQADINGTVTIDASNIFGGTKLIVPANWDVKSDVTAIFGGMEDKRDLHSIKADPNKLLIIDGTCMFGGIEIRNF
jgi:predicted membrane protein